MLMSDFLADSGGGTNVGGGGGGGTPFFAACSTIVSFSVEPPRLRRETMLLNRPCFLPPSIGGKPGGGIDGSGGPSFKNEMRSLVPPDPPRASFGWNPTARFLFISGMSSSDVPSRELSWSKDSPLLILPPLLTAAREFVLVRALPGGGAM
jgi:hypothetical protein